MKTKIVATMGPASDNEGILREMILAGVNVFRLNFSHGSHEEQRERIRKIRLMAQMTNRNIAIMLDTKGPEIRVDTLERPIKIQVGSNYALCCPEQRRKESDIPITYKGIADNVVPGDRVLIDDGSISLLVLAIEEPFVVCRAENSGEVRSRKGVNLPGREVDLPALTDKDKKDLLFGIKEDVDFIAASFIRNADHVQEIKDFLKQNGGEMPVIAKIESRSGVEALKEIITAADGLMVARGDLGVEIPLAEVPIIQKEMIGLCNYHGKPVITATQMLESMVQNPRPTRAEVSDIANAILDGTDAIMLSGESAAGKYPLEAVKTMAEIAAATESRIDTEKFRQQEMGSFTITRAIGTAAVQLAEDLQAEAIVIPTATGETARMIARFRPITPLAVTSPNERTCRRLTLTWGVDCSLQEHGRDYDETVAKAIEAAKKQKVLHKGDLAIVTAGASLGSSEKTNSLIAIEV
ncbi:MAG: pyruvate kinase [Bacillota bacterium]|nr:pyruvate kinase [Bacillota bacterium]